MIIYRLDELGFEHYGAYTTFAVRERDSDRVFMCSGHLYNVEYTVGLYYEKIYEITLKDSPKNLLPIPGYSELFPSPTHEYIITADRDAVVVLGDCEDRKALLEYRENFTNPAFMLLGIEYKETKY